MNKLISILLLLVLWTGCSKNKLEEKGFSVVSAEDDSEENGSGGLHKDSLMLQTRPNGVLITGHLQHRLIPVYKVNYHPKTKESFIGSNNFHFSYYDENSDGNNWNGNYMPGFEALYGYNLVNVSHFNHELQKENKLFSKPVLIRTVYYPTSSKDTLNGKAMLRNNYLVSAYDEDTNGDGLISLKDLRRFFVFDVHGENQKLRIPKNYSVFSSQYDSANDFMYVFTRLDKNGNGAVEEKEEIHVFWIDLNNPDKVGLMY